MIVNKEYGSDFHYFFDTNTDKSSLFSDSKFSFFFSGRVALFNLLEFGIKKHQWKKVGFPSYYCHEVVEFCKKLPIEVVYYDFNPLSNTELVEWEDEEKNVFINIDFFGIKKLDTSFLKNSVIIDDVTHNLLNITENEADYCFGSLRKQIPLPVGGFCFSKKNDFVSKIIETELANKTVFQKISAMYLKSLYLTGSFHQKDIFRELYMGAEENFESIETNSRLPEMIKTQLFLMNPEILIKKTRKNFQILKNKVHASEKVTILQTEAATEMGLVLKVDNCQLRNLLRKHLIDNKIYPAVLWPKQFTPANVELENTILFIHCDFRYHEDDINFITTIINNFVRDV